MDVDEPGSGEEDLVPTQQAAANTPAAASTTQAPRSPRRAKEKAQGIDEATRRMLLNLPDGAHGLSAAQSNRMAESPKKVRQTGSSSRALFSSTLQPDSRSREQPKVSRRMKPRASSAEPRESTSESSSESDDDENRFGDHSGEDIPFEDSKVPLSTKKSRMRRESSTERAALKELRRYGFEEHVAPGFIDNVRRMGSRSVHTVFKGLKFNHTRNEK